MVGQIQTEIDTHGRMIHKTKADRGELKKRKTNWRSSGDDEKEEEEQNRDEEKGIKSNEARKSDRNEKKGRSDLVTL